MIKCTNRCNTPGGTSNIVDLISSVNTLIDHLSDPVDDAVGNRSAADINRQLHQLERLFARSATTKPQRRRDHHGRQRTAAAAAAGACSRSPCSNCTASNCNAGSKAPPSQSGNRGPRRRHHSASVTSSSESSSYSRCCIINPGCLPARQQPQAAAASQPAQQRATVLLESYENASNRRQYILRRRKMQRPAQRNEKQPQAARPHGGGGGADSAAARGASERVDFGYLKSGLLDGEYQEKEKGHGCAANVVTMERMVHNMQAQVDQLRFRCEQQQQQQQRQKQQSCCVPPHRLKAEIQRARGRVSLLQGMLQRRQQAGGAAGCRHRGGATEQARDALCDIKCKYERCLLYSRFDVNWPFLHIIAPRLPSWGEPICCEED